MNKETYEMKPAAMRDYLSSYGWHFNKKMEEWAVSMMRDKSGKPIKPITREALETMLKANIIDLHTEHIYDALYVANMCLADFMGSSIADEKHLLMFVADYMNDPDGYSGQAFVRFYADTCVKNDCTIYWEDML